MRVPGGATLQFHTEIYKASKTEKCVRIPKIDEYMQK